MFDRKSDYALNKQDPEAIVCKSATGVHIRPDPAGLRQPGRSLNAGNTGRTRTTTKLSGGIMCMPTTPFQRTRVEVSITVISPEDELMEVLSRQEQEELSRRLETGLRPA